MVVKKGFLTWSLTFSWAILYVGCFLTSTVNGNSAVVQSETDRGGNDDSTEEEEPETSPKMLKIQQDSLEDCAKACSEEKRMKCKFFKYKKESKTCFMSSEMHEEVKEEIKLEIGDVSSKNKAGGKDMTKWIDLVESRLAELEEQDRQIEALKNSLSDMREELRMMRKTTMTESRQVTKAVEAQQGIYKDMKRNMVGIRIEGEKVKSAVHAMSNMQRVLAKEINGLKSDVSTLQQSLNELQRTSGDISNLMASLKATDTALQRELDAVKEGANSLAAVFAKHRQMVNEKLASQQMTPAMIKMKHNQGTLATALESVMDKVSNLMSRLPYLEDELRGTNKNVANQAMYEHELRAKLITFYKNLIEIKRAVHTLLDPRSAINMERGKKLLMLASDISMLTQRDKDTRGEVTQQRDDLARLVRDVAHVQIMAQNLGDQLTKVLAASRKFQQDIADIRKRIKEPQSEVKMAEMQKQVMTTLDRLKTREAILLKELNLYRSSVKKLTDQVQKSSITKSTTEDAVHDLQRRLGRFEKQIQLLFDKTTTLTSKLAIKPTNFERAMEKLTQSQTSTSNRVEDIKSELTSIRKRLSLLAMDLEQTKKEEMQEKMAMAKDVMERQEQMKERVHELKEQALYEKKEEAKAMKLKAKELEKETKMEKKKMEKELQWEHNKMLAEKEAKQRAVEMERNKRKKEQEAYRKKLEQQKKELQNKMEGIKKHKQGQLGQRAGKGMKKPPKVTGKRMKKPPKVTVDVKKKMKPAASETERLQVKEVFEEKGKKPPRAKKVTKAGKAGKGMPKQRQGKEKQSNVKIEEVIKNRSKPKSRKKERMPQKTEIIEVRDKIEGADSGNKIEQKEQIPLVKSKGKKERNKPAKSKGKKGRIQPEEIIEIDKGKGKAELTEPDTGIAKEVIEVLEKEKGKEDRIVLDTDIAKEEVIKIIEKGNGEEAKIEIDKGKKGRGSKKKAKDQSVIKVKPSKRKHNRG